MHPQLDSTGTNTSKTPSKRNPFQADEDIKLRELVALYGDNNWMTIANQMPGRTVRQCRERYQNNLSSDVKNEKWSKAEEELLKRMVYQFGPRWKYFEEFFPGRTSYNIRNKWNCILRKWKNYSSYNTKDTIYRNIIHETGIPSMNNSLSVNDIEANASNYPEPDIEEYFFQDSFPINVEDEWNYFDEITFENSVSY